LYAEEDETRLSLRSPRPNAHLEAEPGDDLEAVDRPPLLKRLLGRFRKRRATKILHPMAIAPSVILACAKCGFDYSITTVDFGQARTGAFWVCACGSQYIPPGGPDSFNLVRP
jgi:hypothetical protein